MTTKELFFFIVDPTITSSNRDAHLDRLKESASQRDPINISPELRAEEETFMGVFIPRTLNQVRIYASIFSKVIDVMTESIFISGHRL